MGFLIRSAFWLSLVLLLIPFGTDGDGDTVSPLQAISAASEAASDMAGLCERKPEVCTIGKSALHTIGVRARAGAKLAYEMLDEHAGKAGSAAKQDSPAGTESAGQAD